MNVKLKYVLFLLSFYVTSAGAETLSSLFGIDDSEVLSNEKNNGKRATVNTNILVERMSKDTIQPTIKPPPLDYYYYGESSIETSTNSLESSTESIGLSTILSTPNNIDNELRLKGVNVYKCIAPDDDCTIKLDLDLNNFPTGSLQWADYYFLGTDQSPVFFDFANGKPKYVFIYWHGGAWLKNDPRYISTGANSIRQRQFINFLESILVNDGSFDAMVVSVSYLEGYSDTKGLAEMYDGYLGNISNISQYNLYNSIPLPNTIAQSFRLVLEYINAAVSPYTVQYWTTGDSAGAWIAQRLATDRKVRLDGKPSFDSIVTGSVITGLPTLNVNNYGELGNECGSDYPYTYPYIENATNLSLCESLRWRYFSSPSYYYLSNNINDLKHYSLGTDNFTVYLNTACDYWSEVKDARNEWLYLLPQDKLNIGIEKKYLDFYNNSGSGDDIDDGSKPKFYDDPDLIDIDTPIPVGNGHNFQHVYPSFFNLLNWKVTIENDPYGNVISALGDISYYDGSVGTTPIYKLDAAVNNQPYGRKGVVYMCHE